MKIKFKNLVQFLYCVFYICILILNIYAMYIDSLMPRLISYLLIVLIFMMHFRTSRNQKVKSLKRILLISGSFLIISLLSIAIYNNKSILTFEFLWNVVQPSVFILTGAVIGIRVEKKNRNILYNFIMAGIFFTIMYDFMGQYITYDNRHYSVYTNALLYGSFILIAFHFTYFLIKNIYLKVVLLLLCTYACILTYSRSAWVALAITFLVSKLFGKNEILSMRKLMSYYVFMIILFCVVTVFGSYLETIFNEIIFIVSGKFRNITQSTSAILRVGAIMYLLKNSSIVSVILGNGAGAAKALISNSSIEISRFETSDNQYISIIYDYGLVGVFWIIKLCQLVFRNAFFNQQPYSSELKMLSVIVLSLMITGFFFETIGNANLAAITLTFIGMLYQLDYEHRWSKQQK